MPKRTLIYLLLFISVSVKAQYTDTAFAVAHYTFVYLSDTTMPADKEQMILYLGKNTSAYKSYDRILSDSVVKAQMDSLRNIPIESIKSITMGTPGMKRGTTEAVYKDFRTQKMDRIENLMKNYQVPDVIPEINWTIAQEAKNIQGLQCQKATASFRGRNYTAWFCPQLPYNNGPWKLGGLPGLIIEAADEKNEVVFQFSGFEDISAKKIAIVLPKDAIPTTDKEYRQLKNVIEKDPVGYMNNRMAEAGMPGLSFRPAGRVSAPAKRRVNNNPIEKIL